MKSIAKRTLWLVLAGLCTYTLVGLLWTTLDSRAIAQRRACMDQLGSLANRLEEADGVQVLIQHLGTPGRVEQRIIQTPSDRPSEVELVFFYSYKFGVGFPGFSMYEVTLDVVIVPSGNAFRIKGTRLSETFG